MLRLYIVNPLRRMSPLLLLKVKFRESVIQLTLISRE